MEDKNSYLKKLIIDLKILGEKSAAWKKVSDDLKRPSRIRREVDLNKIGTFSKDGLTAVVPGKVLGSGTLDKKVDVAAYQFAQSAKERIEKAGGKAILLSDYIKKNPEGKNIIILG